MQDGRRDGSSGIVQAGSASRPQQGAQGRSPAPSDRDLPALLDSLQTLAATHLRLGRLELRGDARWLGLRLGLLFGLLPLTTVGVALLGAAAAALLAERWSWPAALGIVGAAALLPALAGVGIVARQLARREFMYRTFQELDRPARAGGTS